MGQPHDMVQAPRDNEIGPFPIFWARAKYKFADDAGAQGDINLLPSAVIPAGALILAAFINVIVAPTGATATIALKCEGAADLQSAAAINGAPWSTLGLKACTKTFATAPIKTTAARNVAATVGTANLTAGEFEVLVAYLAPGVVT